MQDWKRNKVKHIDVKEVLYKSAVDKPDNLFCKNDLRFYYNLERK